MKNIEQFRKENILSIKEIIEQIFDDDNERVEEWLNASFDEDGNFQRKGIWGDIWDGLEIQIDYYLQKARRFDTELQTLTDDELNELCEMLTNEAYDYHESYASRDESEEER